MKTEKVFAYLHLFNFVEKNLPLTLKAVKEYDGYGVDCYICRSNDRGGWFSGPPKIAVIFEHTITLYHPEYFSDIEDLLRRYESIYHRETTLRYYDEAPQLPPSP